MHYLEAYKNIRRTQAKIVRYNLFQNGELFDLLHRKSFDIYARHLANLYFHKSKNVELYSLIVDLFKIYLVIAPILQCIKYSYKLDWTRGHFLSWIRIYTNKKINRKYIQIRSIPREVNPEKLITNLLKLGIKDKPFVDLLVDCFKQSYSLSVVRGKLANCVFDPIFFLNEKTGFELRRGNEFVKLEKKKFPGCIDIDKESFIVWDYQIKRIVDKKTKKTTLHISINPDDIKNFKENIKRIVNSKQSNERKILLIYNRINSFIEKHKYTKDGFDCILDLKYWLRRNVKKISAQDKRIKYVVDSILEEWNKKVITKLLVKKPNFFWNPELIDEKTYRYYFNPYREG